MTPLHRKRTTAAIKVGAAKLPVRTKVVTRLDAGIVHMEQAA